MDWDQFEGEDIVVEAEEELESIGTAAEEKLESIGIVVEEELEGIAAAAAVVVVVVVEGSFVGNVAEEDTVVKEGTAEHADAASYRVEQQTEHHMLHPPEILT